MRRKMHVRFGERDRADRHEQSWYGGPVSTLCNPVPSPADVELTRCAAQAGELLGIALLDHVVIGRGRHASLRQLGLYHPPGHTPGAMPSEED